MVSDALHHIAERQLARQSVPVVHNRGTVLAVPGVNCGVRNGRD